MSENDPYNLPEISSELEESIKLLENEICWISIKWRIYRQLFGTSKGNIDLLNKFSPVTFKVFQDVLYNDTLASICKITEKAKTCGNDNLTIDRLLLLVDKNKYEDLYSKLVEIEKQINDKYDNIRIQRNKTISHIDFNAIKSDYKSLKGVSRKNINDVLELIYKFMNEINLYFYNSQTGYQYTVTKGGEGDYLIRQLKKLDKYNEKYDPYWNL